MLDFHYQEKYVNVAFTDLNITSKQVGTDLTRRTGHLITMF